MSLPQAHAGRLRATEMRLIAFLATASHGGVAITIVFRLYGERLFPSQLAQGHAPHHRRTETPTAESATLADNLKTYVPPLAHLLMSSLFICDGINQLLSPYLFAHISRACMFRYPMRQFGSRIQESSDGGWFLYVIAFGAGAVTIDGKAG